MASACRTYGVDEMCIQSLVSNSEEEDHLKDPGVDGRMTLKWILKPWDGIMNWIDLAQNGAGGGLMNALISLRIP